MWLSVHLFLQHRHQVHLPNVSQRAVTLRREPLAPSLSCTTESSIPLARPWVWEDLGVLHKFLNGGSACAACHRRHHPLERQMIHVHLQRTTSAMSHPIATRARIALIVALASAVMAMPKPRPASAHQHRSALCRVRALALDRVPKRLGVRAIQVKCVSFALRPRAQWHHLHLHRHHLLIQILVSIWPTWVLAQFLFLWSSCLQFGHFEAGRVAVSQRQVSSRCWLLDSEVK